jgi:SLT domain-containing protein
MAGWGAHSSSASQIEFPLRCFSASQRPRVFSHIWNIGPIQIQAILYKHRSTYRAYIQKWEEEKKEREIMNNNEIHHFCAGIRYKETRWKLLNNTGWGKSGRKYSVGGLH